MKKLTIALFLGVILGFYGLMNAMGKKPMRVIVWDKTPKGAAIVQVNKQGKVVKEIHVPGTYKGPTHKLRAKRIKFEMGPKENVCFMRSGLYQRGVPLVQSWVRDFGLTLDELITKTEFNLSFFKGKGLKNLSILVEVINPDNSYVKCHFTIYNYLFTLDDMLELGKIMFNMDLMEDAQKTSSEKYNDLLRMNNTLKKLIQKYGEKAKRESISDLYVLHKVLKRMIQKYAIEMKQEETAEAKLNILK